MKLPADQYYLYIFVCLKSQRCSSRSHIRQNSSVFVTFNWPRMTSGKKYWSSSPDLLYVNALVQLAFAKECGRVRLSNTMSSICLAICRVCFEQLLLLDYNFTLMELGKNV